VKTTYVYVLNGSIVYLGFYYLSWVHIFFKCLLSTSPGFFLQWTFLWTIQKTTTHIIRQICCPQKSVARSNCPPWPPKYFTDIWWAPLYKDNRWSGLFSFGLLIWFFVSDNSAVFLVCVSFYNDDWKPSFNSREMDADKKIT